jgi:3-oxoacyl-(acyl-carrier-protein) synthase
MRLALDDARIVATDVDVVYASANSTQMLDRIETQALSEVFGGSRTMVTSIKGAIGECGASSAAVVVAAALCGSVSAVPPIAGLSSPDPASASLNLATSRVRAPARVALVNAFASGGALFSVVLRVDPASDRL